MQQALTADLAVKGDPSGSQAAGKGGQHTGSTTGKDVHNACVNTSGV